MLSLKCFLAVGGALAMSGVAWSQAIHTASRAGDLQVGAEFTGDISRYLPVDTQGNPDPLYVLNFRPKFLGGGVYGSFDFKEHWGGVVDFRHLVAHGGDGSTQTTYALGGRYIVLHKWGFAPYGKVEYGRAVYNYPQSLANLAFNELVYSGGTDYALTRSIHLRAEYEFQQWFNVPLRSPAPNVGSIGVAYHFHGGPLER